MKPRSGADRSEPYSQTLPIQAAGQSLVTNPRKICRVGRELGKFDCRYWTGIPLTKAGPRKARRRGLQRTTSALTATVLGAVLTAATAVARQAPAPDDAPPVGTSSTTTKTGPESASEAANSQLYGMSVTRGARYLLRNGLDYLSYQQYDRALKFLREAEARVNDQKTRKVQMELNGAEVTALKQGIEAAQRGLRRASNAESPYALSDKSRPANGFTPAKPSTLVAARGGKANSLSRNAKAAPVTPRELLGSEGDDPGQPVRLASGEMPASDQPGEIDPTVRPGPTNNPAASRPTIADGSATIPEAPQIPLVSPPARSDGSQRTRASGGSRRSASGQR